MSADELADHTKTVSVQPYPVTETRRELYPEIEPFATGRLKVSDLHEIYFEQSGNPNGKPVVFVHGGPGGGTEAKHRRFFNPEKYHIILFDQRGCGKSKPFSCLEQNTTWDLVADMEKIREHLQIDRWMVFGGSWGSTLALAYAETHPERVTQLVLRGIFLLRKKEINWFYQEGASYIYPDAWEHYLKPIPVEERGDLLRAYHKRLTSSDPQVRKEAATAWSVWEGTTSKLYTEPAFASEYAEEEFADAFARIECHYFINEGFFSTEGKGQLIENVHKIRHIPTVIVQGRYDVVCPIVSAWELHKEFPEAKLEIISDAGHSQFEPGITDRLVRACDAFADQ